MELWLWKFAYYHYQLGIYAYSLSHFSSFFFDVWVFNFSLSILVQSLTFANIVSLFTPCHDIMWRNYISTSHHSTSHHIKSHAWANRVLHLFVSAERRSLRLSSLRYRCSTRIALSSDLMWCDVEWCDLMLVGMIVWWSWMSHDVSNTLRAR